MPPNDYKVICISMYRDDLRALDAKVDELKARGIKVANRSALIRYALRHADLSTAKAVDLKPRYCGGGTARISGEGV